MRDLSNRISALKKTFSILFLTAVVFACYAPALQNGFVWDDTALVLRDPLIRSWRLIPTAFDHFLFIDATASNFYRPVQRLSYTLDYAAFAFRPAGYHFMSIFYHAAAVVALWLFGRELLHLSGVEERPRNLVSLAASVAWAVHPVHSSAVIYVSGRADSLAALFGFLGLYLALRSLRSTGPATWLLVVGAGCSFLLSCFSKESGAIFLALWFAILLLRKDWRQMLRAVPVAAFVMAIYFSVRIGANQIPPPPSKTSMPALVRPVVVARAFAEYGGLILLPLNLHMERDVETRPSGFGDASITAASWRELQTLAGILLLAATVWWMVRVRKRDPAVFICLVLALLSYLPVSGLHLLNATVAEHWLYVPSAFFLWAGGLSVARYLVERRPARWTQAAIVAALAIWVAFLCGRTFVRTFDWKDQRRFLEKTMADGGDSARMLINLAGVQLTAGDLDAAQKNLHEALRKEPGQPFALLNLAAVAVKQKEWKVARDILARAIENPLSAPQAHEMLAVVENLESGQIDIRRLRLASRTGPPNWAIEWRYVTLLVETGQVQAAIQELRKVLQTQWYRAETWELLSHLLAKAGRHSEAAEAAANAHAYDVHLARRSGG